MTRQAKENAINNSHQIKAEFSQRNRAYKPPTYKPFKSHNTKPSAVKTYTPKEIFIYKIKQLSIRFAICGNL